jgi:hypothetical protein
MQKLVLYIGNQGVYTEEQRVDLFKDESVSFTQTIQNVKDIKKIFTEFTKTFAVPASKRNNKIFEHYYNFNVSNGFDARIKVDAALELNDIPYKTGKIALTGVDLKNNLAHTYKITFYGNTVDLKDILGESQLSTLSSLSQYNTNYNFSTVLATMQSAQFSGDLLVPLITHTDRLKYDTSSNTYGNLYFRNLFGNTGVSWFQFKYALRLKSIIDAIQIDYPITFSNDFFNNSSNTDFNNLFMWLHRKKGNVAEENQVERIYTTLTELQQTATNGNNISSVTNGQLNLNLPVPKIQWRYSSTSLRLKPTNLTQNYSVRVIRNGFGEVGGFVDQQGEQFVSFTPTVLDDNSTYTVEVSSATTLSLQAGEIEWIITAIDLQDPSALNQQTYSNQNAFSSNLDLEFNITEQIPQMKIIDFLTGLFQMFNLTAYINEIGTIVVETLDDYYASSSQIINIDEYLDTKQSKVDIALPFKEINFGYKGVNTFLAKQFNQLNNTQWGSLSYTLDGAIYDAPEESYKIELPFEHLMFERLYNASGSNTSTDVQYGYFTNENQEAYFGLPLIFYPILQTGTGTTPITIRDVTDSSRVPITSYYIPSNSKSLLSGTSKTTIHFNVEMNEYTANEPNIDINKFTDTLFQTKYKTYIEDVFNSQRRLTKVTAFLPYKIFSSLELNDTIQLGQNNYRINSLKTNLTNGKTEFELLNTIL